jgi:cytosine deaminase
VTTKDPFLTEAIREARRGMEEGGSPVGAVLVVDGRIVGRGRNRRIQERSPILHAEMDCLRDAGVLDRDFYRRAVMYSTMSPCDMCSGAIVWFGIPKVVIGENKTYRGPEEYLVQRGIEVVVLDDPTCIRLTERWKKEHGRV